MCKKQTLFIGSILQNIINSNVIFKFVLKIMLPLLRKFLTYL